MKDPQPKEGFPPSQDGDDASPQVGQFIDMTFSASKSPSTSSFAWPSPSVGGSPRSSDSQEFGFASNLMGSTEVAPADELFFKGQLLPLLTRHKHHLVQTLSSTCSSHEQTSPHSAHPPASTQLATDLSGDDEVIEFSSCRLEREFSLDYFKHSCCRSSNSFLQTSEERLSFSRLGNLGPCCNDKIMARADVDCNAWGENRCLADCGSERSFVSLYEDGDLSPHKHDTGAVDYRAAHMIDVIPDPGSSSFRSLNSGYWDSGAEKDMMDSSSSRDSNGSSQDSYFHTNREHVEVPSCINAPAHSRSKLSFNIPWRFSVFRRGRKQQSPHLSSSSFSEDLGKYKGFFVPPLKEVKEALLPWKLDQREANQHQSCVSQQPAKQGKEQRRRHPFGVNINVSSAIVPTLCKNSTQVCDASAKKSRICKGSTSSRLPASKSIDAGATDRETMNKQGSAVVSTSERWQMYERRLKPLYEMKRAWMGQLRVDECGKGAYCEVEVEQGSLQSSKQRGLYHQSSFSNLSKGSRKPPLKQRLSQALRSNPKPNTFAGDNYRVLAMSSCPTSTISSPSHSGVLAVIDTNQRFSNSNPAKLGKMLKQPLGSSSQDGACGNKSSGNACSAVNNGSAPLTAGNSDTSMSTMHELHSAVQSAIAHCKESQMKLNSAPF